MQSPVADVTDAVEVELSRAGWSRLPLRDSDLLVFHRRGTDDSVARFAPRDRYLLMVLSEAETDSTSLATFLIELDRENDYGTSRALSRPWDRVDELEQVMNRIRQSLDRDGR